MRESTIANKPDPCVVSIGDSGGSPATSAAQPAPRRPPGRRCRPLACGSSGQLRAQKGLRSSFLLPPFLSSPSLPHVCSEPYGSKAAAAELGLLDPGALLTDPVPCTSDLARGDRCVRRPEDALASVPQVVPVNGAGSRLLLPVGRDRRAMMPLLVSAASTCTLLMPRCFPAVIAGGRDGASPPVHPASVR
jgi:hypothetical protein